MKKKQKEQEKSTNNKRVSKIKALFMPFFMINFFYNLFALFPYYVFLLFPSFFVFAYHFAPHFLTFFIKFLLVNSIK